MFRDLTHSTIMYGFSDSEIKWLYVLSYSLIILAKVSFFITYIDDKSSSSCCVLSKQQENIVSANSAINNILFIVLVIIFLSQVKQTPRFCMSNSKPWKNRESIRNLLLNHIYMCFEYFEDNHLSIMAIELPFLKELSY